MPAAVIPFGASLKAEFALLSIAPPSTPAIPFGVLLLDPATGSLDWKFREDRDIENLPLSSDDAEYLRALDADFRARTAEMSGTAFLVSLEDSLSGFLRISDREVVSGRSISQLLDRLFDRHIDSRVQPYVTHLPLFGLRAAATKFGDDSEVDESAVEWVRVPTGLRVSEDQFVVQVVGRSMEPLIADGSLVVFRRFGAGSRQGKRVLIEELGATGTSARFTVKKYTSVKRQSGEDEWSHAVIRLEPLNPEFPAFELDAEAFENKYRVIGEFVQVLPSED